MAEDSETLYSPSCWSKKHKNKDDVISHFLSYLNSSSQELINGSIKETGISYGDSEAEKIDIFYPSHPKEHHKNIVVVIIHGGYWQMCNKEMYTLMATYVLNAGYIAVTIGYDLAPKINLKGIVNQIDSGVAFISQYFNNKSLVLLGHSAGAYLAVKAACNSELSSIKGIIPVSGIYDLVPLIETTINDPLKLTKEEAIDLSLVKDLNIPSYVKVLLLAGKDESPAFVKQSKDIYEKLKNKLDDVTLEIVSDEDHFSIIENFYVKDHVIVELVLKFLQKLN